jgi:O-antigen ligase
MRLWDGAVNFQEDHWSGIYFNRNSLAPVASIAIVAALGLVSTETLRKETGSLKRVTVVLAMLALGVVSGIELWRSESRTSPLALAMAVVATTIWLLIRFVFRRVSTLRRLEAFSATTSLTVLAASFYLVFAGIGDVPGIAERVPSLIPRQALWSLSWAGILEKPWLGWGWMAAWHTTEFFNSEASEWSSAWDSDWAHNGYHDVLLGGGLVAAVLLLAFIWAGTQALARRPVQESALRLFLTVFCLSAATQESFFVGSHFVWALLVFALSPLTAATTSVEQKEPGEAAPRTT